MGTNGVYVPSTPANIRPSSPLLIQSMAAKKPASTRKIVPPRKAVAPRKTVAKKSSTVYPLGEPARLASTNNNPAVKLLTRVEQLKLLTKAEKAGLLSAAEKAGISLSLVERLGLLSKAETFGILTAATDPNTPGTLFTLAAALLVLGPVFVYIVPETYPWEIPLQLTVAAVCAVGGSLAFAGSNLLSDLQKSE